MKATNYLSDIKEVKRLILRALRFQIAALDERLRVVDVQLF